QRLPASREHAALHAPERPEEVHRGGPRRGQALDRLLDVGLPGVEVPRAARARGKDHAERGGHADGGRAAHHQGADGVGHLLPGRADALDLLDGQTRLVHEDQPVAVPAKRGDHRAPRSTAAGAPRRARAAVTSRVRKRYILSRPPAPRTSSTVEGATPRAAASRRATAAFARPSWGGALTRTRSAAPCQPTIASREA